MKERYARQLVPTWAGMEEPVHVREDDQTPKTPFRMRVDDMANKILKRYGIFLVCMCIWTISLILCSAIVRHNTEKMVKAEMAGYYDQKIAEYKEEQRQAEQAAHWLSGDASREAAINTEVDAVAAVISKLNTDAQKLTEASCMLARVMSTAYPNSFKEVASQPSQWMFYAPDGDNTFSQHDRDLAEQIVRPYMESGIVPNGLTAEMVYGEWSPNDFVLRDSYQTTSSMHTWRHG